MKKNMVTIIAFLTSVYLINAQDSNIRLEAPNHMNPVSVGATILDGKLAGEKTVLIKTNIMNGYHIYAYVPSGEAYINSEIGIDLIKGVELVGNWEKSAPQTYPGKSHLLIYKNENTFKHKIKVGKEVVKGTKIKCWIYYQCCDARICFPPKKKEIELTL
ncbi:protein-disulfide reductase DsbD domain-containing protein [uncultured Lutibacter sp.]|uniref:protein-disulfide reductase DsbD domain-containing protein n=1 Tax=uncultured Lutibacter sp. TaxID=437739 RepID=UPI00260451CD|nr:protein-disulfide reductase DsbD domain-containing protein [uncultured Lutibacter sp.]